MPRQLEAYFLLMLKFLPDTFIITHNITSDTKTK